MVTLSYDADVVDLLKAVPKHFRSWRPETKQWRIAAWYSPILARIMHARGHVVVGIDVTDPAPQRPRPNLGADTVLQRRRPPIVPIRSTGH